MNNRKIAAVASPQPKKGSPIKWLLVIAGVAVFFIMLFSLVKLVVSSAVPQGNIALITITGEIGGNDTA